MRSSYRSRRSSTDVTGTVIAFDERRGVGTIESGSVRHFFHCTQIADGTRSIRAGQSVEFSVVPGRLGDWEATAIHKIL